MQRRRDQCRKVLLDHRRDDVAVVGAAGEPEEVGVGVAIGAQRADVLVEVALGRCARGHVGDDAAAPRSEDRGSEDGLAAGVELDGEAAFVDQAVVEGAEGQEVLDPGLSASGPVLDVVGVEVAVAGTAGEAAAVVAAGQSTAERGGDGAGAAADVEELAAFVFDGGGEGAVAADAAERLRGNAGAVVEDGDEAVVEGLGLQMEGDEGVVGAGAGSGRGWRFRGDVWGGPVGGGV